MHGPIKVKTPNNTSKWQMGFNLAFKGLMLIYAKVGIRREPEELDGVAVML
jgi:hypothetical protein